MGKYVCIWTYVRLFVGEHSKLVHQKDLEILPDLFEKADTKKIISYYYELAHLLGSTREESAYISRFYQDRLNCLLPESIAHVFVTGIATSHEAFTDSPLFPFRINLSLRVSPSFNHCSCD